MKNMKILFNEKKEWWFNNIKYEIILIIINMLSQQLSFDKWF